MTATLTERLELSPMTLDDLPAMFEIMSDPDGWWFDPAGRHAEVSETRALIHRAMDSERVDGLSYWTARRRSDGAIVGMGGVRRKDGKWNLAYRIARDHQRTGYAVEIARAGIQAANATAPGDAVIAWIDEVNGPSIRVAERLGLILWGLRADPTDGVDRLAYADRAGAELSR